MAQKVYVGGGKCKRMRAETNFLFKLLRCTAICCIALCNATCKSSHGGFITLRDCSLYYEERGVGEPLIFIHGHSLDSRMWQNQVEQFSEEYRVITYDARGYGLSSKQQEGLLFTHADDLYALMDSLRIGKAHLVGLSMGGFIVGDMLAIYPERLLSATMCEGHIRSTPSINQPTSEAERIEKQRSIDAVNREGLTAYKRRWFSNLMNGGSKVSQIGDRLWEMIDHWDGWQATHHEVHCYYGNEAMDSLKSRQPSIPTLFIEGQRPDGAAPQPNKMMHYLPNCKMVTIPDCGHLINMERPKEFNEALSHFLTSIKR